MVIYIFFIISLFKPILAIVQNEMTTDDTRFLIERFCKYIAEKPSKISFTRFCYYGKSHAYVCDFFKHLVDDAFAKLVLKINFEILNFDDRTEEEGHKKFDIPFLCQHKLLLLHGKSEETFYEILVQTLMIKLFNAGENDSLQMIQMMGKSSKQLESLVRKNIDARKSSLLSTDELISIDSQQKLLEV